MTQEPQKNNSILIIVAVIGLVGTITATIIGVIGNYNIEKLRQEAELTKIAFSSSTSMQTENTQIPTTTSPLLSPSQTPQPTMTSVLLPPSQTSQPTSIKDVSNLFHEDFEDGKTQQITYMSSGWRIIQDEVGNSIFDMDNSKSSVEANIDLGSNKWEDYEIKFRTRIISGSSILVYFRINQITYNGYLALIEPAKVSLYDIRGASPTWTIMTTREYRVNKNQWHWISVKANGSEITISVNGDDVIATENSLHKLGYVNIQVSPYAHAQFDDIQVKSLEE